MAHRAEPETLNPLPAADAPSQEVIRLLHSYLITINHDRHLKEQALAASGRIGNDRRAYTLHCLNGGDADPNRERNVCLSRESMHFRNRNPAARATPWEARLNQQRKGQTSTLDPARYFAMPRECERPFFGMASPHILGAACALPDSNTPWNAEFVYRISKR